MKNLSKLIFFFLLILSTKSFATHNYAGEIIVVQTGPLTIKATIITYTIAATIPSDRSLLTMNWGDGSKEDVTRSGTGEILDDGTFKKNAYTTTHTFSKAGKYTIWMTDIFRNGGILNVNFPQSDLVAFHLQTTITLVADASNQKFNSTPVFKTYSIKAAYVGKPLSIDNSTTDADADRDSVAYRLVTPLESLNKSVKSYLAVNSIVPGDNNKASINEKTGLFVWDAPQKVGSYAIAIQAISYRSGVAIDTTIRDLQIDIQSLTANEELSETPLVQIGANPFAQESVLNFNKNIGSVTLSAYDLSGKLLLNVALENPQSYLLTKAVLGSGIRLIKIKAARREQVLKIVIE
jgi:hypothetical protein